MGYLCIQPLKNNLSFSNLNSQVVVDRNYCLMEHAKNARNTQDHRAQGKGKLSAKPTGVYQIRFFKSRDSVKIADYLRSLINFREPVLRLFVEGFPL